MRVPALTRRAALAAAAGFAAAPAAAKDRCALGLPADHVKGPPVFLDYDQVELDAAYDQEAYQPHTTRVNQRLAFRSSYARARLGAPLRFAYGADPVEGLEVWPAKESNASIFLFIHGGIWQTLTAQISGFAAEPFVDAGATFVAIDFADVRTVGGDLGVLADQVRRAIAWTWRHAREFGADPDRLYIGGHSSGGHLAAVALVTDWAAHDLPPDAIKGGICISGMYDLAPVRLSWRRSYIAFTDAMEAAMSPRRHLERVACPIVVAAGTLETPEFQRQADEFSRALRNAGKPVELVWGQSYFHQDMWESLGNPYSVAGRAALAMMGLGPA